MDVKQLSLRPSLELYKKQAKDLLKARAAGDLDALRRIRQYHPRFRRFPESETNEAVFALADAQLTIAREHGFESWPKFSRHIRELNRDGSAGSRFEAAAEAVIAGDLSTLERLLREDPGLIRARSSREHGATLLHYVAANGIEDFRQKTPANAAPVARTLSRPVRPWMRR